MRVAHTASVAEEHRRAQDQDALAPQVGGSGRDTDTEMHRPVSTASVKRVVRVVFQEQSSLRSEVLVPGCQVDDTHSDGLPGWASRNKSDFGNVTWENGSATLPAFTVNLWEYAKS